MVKASKEHLELVKEITYKTITEVYPHYYPNGVVEFFLTHHKTENIKKDIDSGSVYLLMDGGKGIGTVTLRGNEICRLFVLPKWQHQGFGKRLLDFAEEMIGENYSEILIDSSLPAKQMYLKRGYIATETHKIVADNRDILVYDVMKK
ncbi:MAG: GNAT family N-acetyltransferase [Lachnospiraceae bacterium]|nr:GNAT family N-acetyltransferase [Lachnospiraceae bacterium]